MTELWEPLRHNDRTSEQVREGDRTREEIGDGHVFRKKIQLPKSVSCQYTQTPPHTYTQNPWSLEVNLLRLSCFPSPPSMHKILLIDRGQGAILSAHLSCSPHTAGRVGVDSSKRHKQKPDSYSKRPQLPVCWIFSFKLLQFQKSSKRGFTDITETGKVVYIN